jgi:hypothetical protein
MAWKKDLANLIDNLEEETQFPFARLEGDLNALLSLVSYIEGEINEPVRDQLEKDIMRIIRSHQRCLGAFIVFHAMLVQQARLESSQGDTNG